MNRRLGESHPHSLERAAEKRREPGAEIISRVAADLENLVAEYGTNSVEEILRLVKGALEKGRGVTKEELTETIEHLTPHSEFQKDALSELERTHCIKVLSDGTLLVDEDKLFSIGVRETEGGKRGDRVSALGMEQYGKSRLEFFGNAFAGKTAILRRDAEKGDLNEKPLFYLPKNRNNALNIEEIRRADFHFGLWELSRAFWSLDKGIDNLDIPQPARLNGGSALETSLAALIYHPRYGNGERNEKGQLFVTDKDGKRIPFTTTWLSKQPGFGFSRDGKPRALSGKPAEILKKTVPEIFQRGLLTEGDFREKGKDLTKAESLTVSSSGMVIINGVRHYLGRNLAQKTVRLEPLNTEQWVVVTVDEQNLGSPASIFHLQQRDNPDLTIRKTQTGSFKEAGAKLTKPLSFDLAKETGIADTEDVERFEVLLSFDNALRKEVLGSIRALPADIENEVRRHPDVIKKYGDNFVATEKSAPGSLTPLLLTLDVPGIPEKLPTILSKLSENERETFVNSITTAARARLETLKEDPDPRLVLELNRRLVSLVSAADDAELSKQTLHAQSREERFTHAAQQGAEYELFGKIFREAFKKHPELTIEDVRGLKLNKCKPEEISKPMRQQMTRMFDENWKDQDPVAAAAFKDMLLKKSAPSNQETHFYLLEKEQRLIAFIRFDHRDDLAPGAYYAGSLNIGPEERGNMIGTAFIKETLNKEAEEHTLYANVVPDAIVATKYVEDGLVITGLEEVRVGDKKTLELAIRNDRRLNALYKARQPDVTPDMLLKGVQGVRVEKFFYKKEKQKFLDAIQKASVHGEVATRYWHDPNNADVRYLAFEAEEPTPPKSED